MAKKNKNDNFENFLEDNWDILGPIVEKVKLPEGPQKHVLHAPKNLRSTLEFSPSKINPILYAKHHAEKRGLDVETQVKQAEQGVEKLKAYNKRLLDSPDRVRYISKQNPTEQLMDYDKARVLFWRGYLSKCIRKTKENPSGMFIVDDYNRCEIADLLKYFIQDPSSPYDLDKGICLHGPVGTGKTIILRQLSNFAKDQGFHNSFPVVSVKKINLEVAKNLDAIKFYSTANFCFDEVVPKTVKSYGTEVNPIDEIIQAQYDRFLLGNKKMIHLTSNINLEPNTQEEADLLNELFDVRSIDRLRQMCNFVYLGGPSRR